MKKVKSLLLAATVIVGLAGHAQTVDDIINKHIDAIGGKDKLSQLKSLYVESSLDIMGTATPSIEYLLQGKGFKQESDYNGMKIINCYGEKGGWSVNPMAGVTDPQAMPDDLYNAGKGQIYFGGALIDYASKGNKVELQGKEGNDYKIKVTNGSIETDYYIDGTTYNISKTISKGEMMGQAVEITTSYSDYKKTDFGILLSYARSTDFGGFSFTTKVSKVEVNKDIDPKIFDMPTK
jgi:hypothetical protein